MADNTKLTVHVPNDSPNDLSGELRSLVGAFRMRFDADQRRGVLGAPTGAMPRRAVLPPDVPPTPDEMDKVDEVHEVEDAPRISAGAQSLPVIREDLGECTRCKLHPTRTNIVFGVGSPNAEIMFIGEAPGRDEDAQGEPFVGRAGQLLTKMIEAMGLTREQVYIANILKCRPPDNRTPEPDEVAACEPFLRRQIESIRPRILVLLGSIAAQTLLRTRTGITALRGRFHVYQGVQTMPTYHPAFLLRSPHMKKPAWEDLKIVMAEMDRLGLHRRR